MILKIQVFEEKSPTSTRSVWEEADRSNRMVDRPENRKTPK